MKVGHSVHVSRLSANIDDFQAVAENTNLKKKDLRAFIFLACRLDSKHVTRIDKKQMANSLGMSKDEVNEALSNLIKNEIIVEDTDNHVRNGYRFSYS